jgi:hypothetical protein
MLTQVREGAINRALELGYCVDEFFQDQYSPDRLKTVLRNRGIRGLLISPPMATGETRLQLDVSEFACVSLGEALLHPAVNNVRINHFHGMQLALHYARQKFGGGIAAFSTAEADRSAGHSWRAAFISHHPAGQIDSVNLFFDSSSVRRNPTSALLKKYQIRCIITESLETVPSWVYEEVRKENVISLTAPGRTPCCGWIKARWDFLGAWGVDLLTDCMERREYGIPSFQKIILAPLEWVEGTMCGLPE